MPELPRPERVAPPSREYSFEACPVEELSVCCSYEFLASNTVILAAVERFRAGFTDRLAKAVVPIFPINLAWALFGGWWPQPYLDIPSATRHANILSPQREDLAYLVAPWTHLSETDRIIAVYVTRAPLPILKKAFADLLRRDYPHLLAPEPVDPEWQIQKTGRGSSNAQARADLKALSAWRLQKRFGYSAADALAMLRDSTPGAYQDVRAFRRAVKKASEKIAQLEKLLLEFAEKGAALDQ